VLWPASCSMTPLRTFGRDGRLARRPAGRDAGQMMTLPALPMPPAVPSLPMRAAHLSRPALPPDAAQAAQRTRRTSRRVAATIAAAGLVLGACGAPVAPDATPVAPAPAPGPTAPTPGPAAPTEIPEIVPTLPVFLVRSAPTTFHVEPIDADLSDVFDDVASLAGRGPEARELTALDVATRVELAVRALLATTDAIAGGATLPGVDPELSSSVPVGTTLLGVTLDGATVTLDLGGALAAGSSGGSAQEVTFAEQLAHTVGVDPSVTALRLKVDGVLVDELWGHLDWSRPVTADPFALSPVTIESPVHGELVGIDGAAGPVSIEVRGQATVFEATVTVRAFDASGALVAEGFVTASMGAPERGTWVWQVELDGPGVYRVEASEDDPSGGEGRPPYVVSRTFELR
jgi:hypothetical protein